MSDQHDTPPTTQRAADADTYPVATQRQASYFAEAKEVCPRCLAEDYYPVKGAPGLRQCVACGQIYRPEEQTDAEPNA